MYAHAASRRNIFLLMAIAIAAIAGTMIYTGVASGDDDDDRNGKRYEVTITNLTKGQVISPAVVATHTGALEPIYTLGEPASDELAKVAEDAILDPLVMMLEEDDAVSSVAVLTGEGGPIVPGETAKIVITASGRASEVSLAAMLVSTNDAFVALNGARLPAWRTETYYSPGYDAGTEANNEDCAFIPGPPCGNPEVRDTDGAEGYVYISNGVHGIADLDPAMHDWRNPAAKITVRRLRANDND